MKCDCGNEFNPSNWGNNSKMCPSCVSNRRRFDVKKRAVEYLGGKCQICGYDKCIAALDADHRNPKEKLFALSGKHCNSWEVIRKELDKCDLLCSNCHRERHYYEHQQARQYSEEYESTRHDPVEAVCECCSEKYFRAYGENERKYCSLSCANKRRQHIEWPPIEQLVEKIHNSNFMNVGGLLGVSGNAIRKHLIKFGINPKDIRSIKDNGMKRITGV